MKQLSHLFIYFFLVLNSVNSWAELAESSTDPYLVKQKEECYKRPNKYWDDARARCVERAENKAQRAEETAAGDACLKINDIEQRKACFMEQARKKSGNMNSESERSGSQNLESAVTHAYSVLAIIQRVASGESNCTSRTIFGVTSFAGSISDIYLRMKAKKKMKELQDKYEIDVKTKRYDAQVKALEYLKEEQETIADIASMEAKRNMIMMAGFGVALGFAIYEATQPATASCTAAPDAKEAAKEGSKEVAKEGAKEASKEVAKEGAKEASKEVAKEGAKEAAKEVAKEGVKAGAEAAASATAAKVGAGIGAGAAIGIGGSAVKDSP